MPDSRLDRLEATLATDDVCGGSGRWRDEDRATIRELIQLTRQARATLEPKWDLTDEADAQKFLDNGLKLLALVVSITATKDDDDLPKRVQYVVDQPNFVRWFASSFGLLKDFRKGA